MEMRNLFFWGDAVLQWKIVDAKIHKQFFYVGLKWRWGVFFTYE
jgi:hypothetical protein